jgi:hypothetical protein
MLAAHASVARLEAVLPPVLDSVTGEEVARIGAPAWHSAGWRGAGVKVAVIDFGFDGYTARQSSGDLPITLTTALFGCATPAGDTNHGTAVAEIVAEVAPEASLYLLCITSVAGLGAAKDYAKAQGIGVIVHSVSWYVYSRGDGSGGPNTPEGIAADARAAGILWVNSAGNRATSHWSGTFQDFNGNGFLDFVPGDEGNTFRLEAGQGGCFHLKWDEWPLATSDYDLYLARSSDGLTVAASTSDQAGDEPPVESLCYTNTEAGQNFFLWIERVHGSGTPRLDLFAHAPANLEYAVAAGSLGETGSTPATLSVGAVCWQNSQLEPYSSQGPTIDGRIKPDLAGYDSLTTATMGSGTRCGVNGFLGTSAAAAGVAGAVALVRAALPSLTVNQTECFLLNRTLALTTGKSNQYGFGLLQLGDPPATSMPPPSGLNPRLFLPTVQGGNARC